MGYSYDVQIYPTETMGMKPLAKQITIILLETGSNTHSRGKELLDSLK